VLEAAVDGSPLEAGASDVVMLLHSLLAGLLKERFCISWLLRRDVDDTWDVGVLLAVSLSEQCQCIF
jgi:hypothetical protein